MGEVKLDIAKQKTEWKLCLTKADESGNKNGYVDSTEEAKAAVDCYLVSNKDGFTTAANDKTKTDFQSFLELLEKSANGIKLSYSYVLPAVKLLTNTDEHSKQTGIQMVYKISETNPNSVPSFIVEIVGNNMANTLSDFPTEQKNMISKILSNLVDKQTTSVFVVIDKYLPSSVITEKQNTINAILDISDKNKTALIGPNTSKILTQNMGALITALYKNYEDANSNVTNLAYSNLGKKLINIVADLAINNIANQNAILAELGTLIQGGDLTAKTAALYVVSLIAEKDINLIPEPIIKSLINCLDSGKDISYFAAKVLSNVAVNSSIIVKKEYFTNISKTHKSDDIFKALIQSGILASETDNASEALIAKESDNKKDAFMTAFNALQYSLEDEEINKIFDLIINSKGKEIKDTDFTMVAESERMNVFNILLELNCLTVSSNTQTSVPKDFLYNDQIKASFIEKFNSRNPLTDKNWEDILSMLKPAKTNLENRDTIINRLNNCLSSQKEDIVAAASFGLNYVSKLNSDLIPDSDIPLLVNNLGNTQVIGPDNIIANNCIKETLANLKERAVEGIKIALNSTNEKIRINACLILDEFEIDFPIDPYQSIALMLDFSNAAWHKTWKNKDLEDKYIGWALKHMDLDTVIEQLEIRLKIEDQKEFALNTAVLFICSLDINKNEDKAKIDRIYSSKIIMDAVTSAIMNSFTSVIDTDKKDKKRDESNNAPQNETINVYMTDLFSKISIKPIMESTAKLLDANKTSKENSLGCYILSCIADKNPSVLKKYLKENDTVLKQIRNYSSKSKCPYKINDMGGYEYAKNILDKIQ